MKLKLYQIDAFADRVFAGNPAAVCPLNEWLEDSVLQSIAEENNLAETTFFVPFKEGYRLRWFTPVAEVNLCGHATLAAAYVLYHYLGHSGPTITFDTLSGRLIVTRKDGMFEMDFPSKDPKPCATPDVMVQALGKAPVEVLCHDDYIAVFQTEGEVREISPELSKLKLLDLRGVAVTARGDECDFVSRFFAPKYGINEDPVTGSSHCELAPYWSKKFGKQKLVARQVSKRGGQLVCEVKQSRVMLAGTAVKYMEAEIEFGSGG